MRRLAALLRQAGSRPTSSAHFGHPNARCKGYWNSSRVNPYDSSDSTSLSVEQQHIANGCNKWDFSPLEGLKANPRFTGSQNALTTRSTDFLIFNRFPFP